MNHIAANLRRKILSESGFILPKGSLRLWILISILSSLLGSSASAQRGLPPKEKTRSSHVTKYPQHLDFLPEMVKLLKVPAGWEVSVAASGLGRPRMLYTGSSGELYIMYLNLFQNQKSSFIPAHKAVCYVDDSKSWERFRI